MEYIIGNKRYNEEEIRQFYEKKRQKQFKYLHEGIFSEKYTDVTGFDEITEEEFFLNLKTAFNIRDLTELLDMGSDNKYYRNFNKRQVIICNGYTNSTPACTSYYCEGIFKYNSNYYKIYMAGSD